MTTKEYFPQSRYKKTHMPLYMQSTFISTRCQLYQLQTVLIGLTRHLILSRMIIMNQHDDDYAYKHINSFFKPKKNP